MDSWGTAKLSSPTLKAIEEANKTCDVEDVPELQKILLEAAQNSRSEVSRLRYGLLKDYPETHEETPEPAEEMEVTPTEIDAHEIATNIAKQVQTTTENINTVIEFVSKINNDEVDLVVKTCWSLLHEEAHKKSFIISMSAMRNSAISICSQVLLPLLQDMDRFHGALNTYGPVFNWLEVNIVDTVVVSLLLSETSPIIQETTCCKELLTHLSDFQKTETVTSFCKTVNTNLKHWQLPTLCIIVEMSPLDQSAVSKLTNTLLENISQFSEDRFMSKIILALITRLSADTPENTLLDVSNLVSQCKGPLRFRLKQALGKIHK